MKNLMILIMFLGSCFLTAHSDWEVYHESNVPKNSKKWQLSKKKVKIEKMLWQTNISDNDILIIKEVIREDKNVFSFEELFKVIFVHDLKSILQEIQSLKANKNYTINFALNYLNSNEKIKFIMDSLAKKFPDDEAWEKGGSGITGAPEPFRSILHGVLLVKQIHYNEKNKTYSNHLIKKIAPKIKPNMGGQGYLYGMKHVYEHWIKHKLEQQIIYNKKYKKYSEHIIKDVLKECEKYKRLRYNLCHQPYKNFLAHKAKAKKENWPIADENGK